MNQPPDPDADARTALRLMGPDPANWVPDRPGIDHNVTIVGGGQTGCALAFALRRAGIGKVTILEAAPDERSAGLWLNVARMNLLRTPKTLPGPELGIPALSSRRGTRRATGRRRILPSTASSVRLGRLSELVQAISPDRPALPTRLTRIEPRAITSGCTSTRRMGPGPKQPEKSSWPQGSSVAVASSSGCVDRQPDARLIRAYRGRDRLRRSPGQDRRRYRRGCVRLRRGRASRWSMVLPRFTCSPDGIRLLRSQ